MNDWTSGSEGFGLFCLDLDVLQKSLCDAIHILEVFFSLIIITISQL